MTTSKYMLLSVLAGFGRACDVPGMFRFVRALYPPQAAVKDPIKTVVDYGPGVRLHIDTSSFIEWAIFFKGYYNLGLTRFLGAFLHPGQAIMDVGANIGQHALIMAKRVGPQGRVYAFEPQPEVRGRFEMNIRLNGFRNVTVIPSALSDRVGTAELHSFGPNTPNKGNATLAATDHPDLSHTLPVEVETLDHATERLKPGRLDFIKIDTQGNDAAVLSGAAKTIAKFRPWITVRYDPGLYAKAGVTYADLQAVFDSHRYRAYIVKKSGLLPIAAGSEVPSELVCGVPEESIKRKRPKGFEV